jgi:hypothetical protein
MQSEQKRRKITTDLTSFWTSYFFLGWGELDVSSDMNATSSQLCLCTQARVITSNDCRDEVLLIFCLFFKLRAGSSTVFLLVISQQARYKFCWNVSHIKRV